MDLKAISERIRRFLMNTVDFVLIAIIALACSSVAIYYVHSRLKRLMESLSYLHETLSKTFVDHKDEIDKLKKDILNVFLELEKIHNLLINQDFKPQIKGKKK